VFEFIDGIRDVASQLNVFVLYIFIFFVGMYVFWRGCAETYKNRSSVFDMFIFSGIFGLILGRILYILLEWENFTSYIWYWLPYEKYGDKIYLFRLLPWRFFSIWDGGLVIFGMFLGLVLFFTFYALVIKGWRWKHMYFPVYFSSIVMLGISLLFAGFVNEISDWLINGSLLIGSTVIASLMYMFIEKIVKDQSKEKYVIGYVGLFITWLSSAYIGYIYLSSELSLLENISVGIFLIWSLVMGVYFLIDLRKARVEIERLSTVRSVGGVR